MLSNLNASARHLLEGDLLLILCCAFYLAWWLLAFKPVGAVKGLRSGWLLLPAFAAGIMAVVHILRGIGGADVRRVLIPDSWVLWGGVAAYVLLLALTWVFWKRTVTTELFLIVGWAMLALFEINALYGSGVLQHGPALAFVTAVAAAALISLVCYMLYYRLDSRAGYLDGTAPLLLAALVMVGLSIALIRANG